SARQRPNLARKLCHRANFKRDPVAPEGNRPLRRRRKPSRREEPPGQQAHEAHPNFSIPAHRFPQIAPATTSLKPTLQFSPHSRSLRSCPTALPASKPARKSCFSTPTAAGSSTISPTSG